MSAAVLVPLADGTWLELERDAFDKARAAGSQAMAIASSAKPPEIASRWLTAEEMAEAFGMDASWFLREARAGTIPHVKAGKYVRFAPSDVANHLNRPPIDTRIPHSMTPRNSLNGKPK